jgi:hypothetical protein
MAVSLTNLLETVHEVEKKTEENISEVFEE